MTRSENYKVYKKSDDFLRKKDFEDDFICNKTIKSEDKSITSRFNYSNTCNELNYSSSQSTCSRYLNTHTFKCPVQNVSSSKEFKSKIEQKRSAEIKVTFEKGFKDEMCENIHKTTQEKNFFDKTTYCRPVINFYNEQFLFKTMEKNTRLKKLVKELMIARQREKETESWKNYINELRKKHGNSNEMRRATSLQYMPEGFVTPGTIEDYYNTKFTCKQSLPCENLLQELYNTYENDTRHPHERFYKTINEYGSVPPKNYTPFETNHICYPTSSQGRMIILERERQKRLSKRGYRTFCNIINEENTFDSTKCTEEYKMKTTNNKNDSLAKVGVVLNNKGTNTMLQSSSTQTKFHFIPTYEDGVKKNMNVKRVVSKHMCTEELNEGGKLKQNAPSTDNVSKQNSLACIEDKLDKLIRSINDFIHEMKTNKCPRLGKKNDLPTKLGKEKVNVTKSDSYSIAKKEKFVCGLGDSSSQSTRYSSKVSFDRIKHMDDNLTKMNEMILKEIGRNKLITLKDSSVGETHHPCSVQISVTIPTKEISTEVTRSLSRAGNKVQNNNIVIEEINPSNREDGQIAIAVNTDPLSLLALLRVSTEETFKKLLSYVPTIDYYYYLSRLQAPPPRALDSHYVCNICGAAFMKPSQLSDHIQKHDLGKTRDCCVCRHVLDMPRRRPGLFKCQYCGQRFTRAYCCELHQQSCARRLGIPHDIPSSLILLR